MQLQLDVCSDKPWTSGYYSLFLPSLPQRQKLLHSLSSLPSDSTPQSLALQLKTIWTVTLLLFNTVFVQRTLRSGTFLSCLGPWPLATVTNRKASFFYTLSLNVTQLELFHRKS